MSTEVPFRYWTWEGLQQFLIDNDLVIATGLATGDDVVITGKGEELYAFFYCLGLNGGFTP